MGVTHSIGDDNIKTTQYFNSCLDNSDTIFFYSKILNCGQPSYLLS